MQKTKNISKNHNSASNQKKKPYRPQFNNNNPNNKLILNKYHQLEDPNARDTKKSDAFKLHKRKRDLERMIKYCEDKKIPVDPAKKEELENIQKQLAGRRRNYEKEKRKQFFLEKKYQDIKKIELRKVYKHLEQTKANPSLSDQEKKKQIEDWEKKLRYIKHFPKNLKYISLFPTSKPLEEKTLEFQKKIMADIEEQNQKRISRLNYYKSENEVSTKKGPRGQVQRVQEGETNKPSILPLTTLEFKTKKGNKTRQVVDDFFVQEQNEENEDNNNQEGKSDDSQEESQMEEDMEIDDEDDMSMDDESEGQDSERN